MPAAALLCALATAALLTADRLGWRPGVWIAKPLAACCFVAIGVLAGALDSVYGRWLLAGLVLSWWGDVLLIPRGRPVVFQAGIASFGLAHVAYAVAFTTLGLDLPALAAGAAAMAVFGWRVLAWLRPKVPADMALPVVGYVWVIGAMTATAGACWAAGATGFIPLGAVLFAASDLSVARDRFVAPAFVNGAWGLPTYFLAQVILAWTPALGAG